MKEVEELSFLGSEGLKIGHAAGINLCLSREASKQLTQIQSNSFKRQLSMENTTVRNFRHLPYAKIKAVTKAFAIVHANSA